MKEMLKNVMQELSGITTTSVNLMNLVPRIKDERFRRSAQEFSTNTIESCIRLSDIARNLNKYNDPSLDSAKESMIQQQLLLAFLKEKKSEWDKMETETRHIIELFEKAVGKI